LSKSWKRADYIQLKLTETSFTFLLPVFYLYFTCISMRNCVCAYSYRVEGEMNADPETVFYFVDPTPQSPRSTWDQAIKELQTVATVSEVRCCLSLSAFWAGL